MQALRDSQNGQLSARDKKQLEELERDVTRIKKARETLGDSAPQFGRNRDSTRENQDGQRGDRGRGRAHYGGLGKRGRDGQRRHQDDDGESEETDEDVRRIPWPKDTPPPIPRPRERPRYDANPNAEPVRNKRFPDRTNHDTGPTEQEQPDTSLPSKPPSAARTTYESKAQVRDLRKEATARFMPQVVRRKVDATRGTGGKLLEEDELEKLEDQGYSGSNARAQSQSQLSAGTTGLEGRQEQIDINEDRDKDEDLRRLREEDAAFEREIRAAQGDGGEITDDDGGESAGPRRVQMEEVSDEEA